ncbi:30S ribosomal protein S16 [Candidatus Kaiserbacteria bacterium CG10_big_fil_rev_8_21_14_0_10_59_10]|uniref:Small ribosomal subunit protein bS16 n=1 Tax=Candidatus Kaiserbacteria bacterium CG10_big_fil_rev_8_21_14_0_10_59_10 TaxID=1974612 RepID=A0A2H0U6Q1_9BACT|nr:MAG: 30S ribosomal protein S16 [Candidatus Kaiserbacteria bacterium CG10_big_fil_rev_8_21_14_0_10_59_10]
MLKIRMQRVGRRNDPAYRVVVTEHTAGPKAGKFVEKVGTYNPKTKARTLNEERVKHWLSVGAQASDTVHNMLVSIGVVSGKKVNVLPKKTVPQKEAEEAPAEAPAPAAAAEEPAASESDEGAPAAAEEEPAAEAPAKEEPAAAAESAETEEEKAA